MYLGSCLAAAGTTPRSFVWPMRATSMYHSHRRKIGWWLSWSALPQVARLSTHPTLALCADLHPDAHACRLKLSLAWLYSDNKAPWETKYDLEAYLHKLPHISADCKLPSADLLTVMFKSKSGTPRIKNQMAVNPAHLSRFHLESRCCVRSKRALTRPR